MELGTNRLDVRLEEGLAVLAVVEGHGSTGVEERYFGYSEKAEDRAEVGLDEVE